MFPLFGLQHHNLILIFSFIGHNTLVSLLLHVACLKLTDFLLIEIDLPLLLIRPMLLISPLLHLPQLLFIMEFLPPILLIDFLSLDLHVHLLDLKGSVRCIIRHPVLVASFLLLPLQLMEPFINIGLLFLVTGHVLLIRMLPLQLPQLIVKIILLLVLVCVVFRQIRSAQACL